MESHTCEHYGWDPLWEAPFIGVTPGAMASPLSPPAYMGFGLDLPTERGSQVADRHLRSVVEIIGYHVEATEGLIGHVENLMLDDADWSLPYLLVDTSQWGFGAHVMIAPVAVTKIEWTDRRIGVKVSCELVKASPTWDPLVAFDAIYVKKLRNHYGWPGSRA